MRALLICPNPELRTKFEASLATFRSVNVLRTLDAYPDKEELSRVVRAWAPEVVFLNIESEAVAEIVAHHLEAEFPAVRRVALHTKQDSSVFCRVLSLRM